MLSLRYYDQKNFGNICSLKINGNQTQFMETNNKAAISEYTRLLKSSSVSYPLEIVVDAVIVGFMLVTKDVIDLEDLQEFAFYNRETFFIWHFMIDEKYQGNGYGKAALNSLEGFLEGLDNADINTIVLFYNKNNTTARNLYHQQGYIDTGFETSSSMLALKII